MAATSLLDVAKAMNGEAAGSSGKLSLLDVAKKEAAAPADGVWTKPATLMDVAKQEVQLSEGHHATRSEKPTLQQLAQEIDKEDRSKIQKALETTAKEVKAERQELHEETLKQAAVEVQQEEQQAAQALRAKVTTVKASKLEATNQSIVKTEEDVDGYSSFEEEEEEPSPNEGKRTKEHADTVEDDASDDDGNSEPPLRTTPSDSKESKEFLRAVYRADKYRIRDMLDEDVDVNIADQHGWSGLHWAASQNHGDILTLLLQKGAEVNAVDQMNGWTALHVAVVREACACIKSLLTAGANARIKDAYGDTVVDCLQAATGKKKAKMLQLLQEPRANSK